MPDIIVRVEQIFMGPAVSAVPIQRGWLRFTDVRRHTPPVERDCRRNPSARKHAATAVCQTDAAYVCAAMCAAGVTKIRTGSVTVPLYAAKQTTPALHVNVGGQACYGNLGSGKATSSINVSYGGNTYHSIR